MSISEKYPELAGFLTGWFAERDLDGRSTFEACVAAFLKEADREDIDDIVSEGEQFLAEDSDALDEIGRMANIHFPNVGETPEAWLKRMLALLKQAR